MRATPHCGGVGAFICLCSAIVSPNILFAKKKKAWSNEVSLWTSFSKKRTKSDATDACANFSCKDAGVGLSVRLAR